MTPGVDVDALGVRVRIRLDDVHGALLREQISRSWAGALPADEAAAARVGQDGNDAAREPDVVVDPPRLDDPDRLQERLTVLVTLKALDRRAGELLMFHACGVAMPDGRVVAFVGPSGRGKSTLAKELGCHFAYVSDETIGVDAGGRVYPHRKPLSLIVGPGAKRQTSPGEAGLLPLPDAPLRLAALVLLDRQQECAEPWMERVPLLDGVAALVPEMSYFTRLPTPLTALAALIGATGGVRRLHYRDATTVAELMTQLLLPGTGEAWEPALRVGEDSLVDVSVSDAVAADDRIAVLAANRMTVLGGVAPTIWEAASTGVGFEGIVKAVVAAHGEADTGDAPGLVRDAIAQLVASGLLKEGASEDQVPN